MYDSHKYMADAARYFARGMYAAYDQAIWDYVATQGGVASIEPRPGEESSVGPLSDGDE